MKSVDYLVIGQGLAGSVFAWMALERGRRVLVVDREEAATSSKVAAGIVNPIPGKRLVRQWRFEEVWPVAKEFYRARTPDCFHERSVLRLLRTPDELNRWERRRLDPSYDAVWESEPAVVDPEAFHPVLGAFETRSGGWLNVPRFLNAAREALIARDAYRTGEGIPANVKASQVVWCQGFEATRNGPFAWLPMRSGKGQILDLSIPGFAETRIVNGGKWLLPMGGDRYRTGSTFEWDATDPSPNAAGREELEAALAEILRLPFQVHESEAAFRPMAKQGHPILGTHPQEPGQAIFNGLGAKGVLLAPFFARQLLDHLETGSPVDREVDVRGYWKG